MRRLEHNLAEPPDDNLSRPLYDGRWDFRPFVSPCNHQSACRFYTRGIELNVGYKCRLCSPLQSTWTIKEKFAYNDSELDYLSDYYTATCEAF